MPALLLLPEQWDNLPYYKLPRSCPKCDCESLKTIFVAENTNYSKRTLKEYSSERTIDVGFPKDTIVVTCNTCGYERYFKPLDSKG